jgi:hypothetical protein
LQEFGKYCSPAKTLGFFRSQSTVNNPIFTHGVV